MHAGLVHGSRYMRQILALAPGRQSVRMMKKSRSFPVFIMIKECNHRPLEMIGKCGEFFNESVAPICLFGQMPVCLVNNGPEALLATHLEYFAKLRVYFVAFDLRHLQPCGEQVVGLGLL